MLVCRGWGRRRVARISVTRGHPWVPARLSSTCVPPPPFLPKFFLNCWLKWYYGEFSWNQNQTWQFTIYYAPWIFFQISQGAFTLVPLWLRHCKDAAQLHYTEDSEPRQWGVNNFPKVASQQCRSRDSNLQPSDRKSDALPQVTASPTGKDYY